MAKCNNCGNEVADNGKFCDNCGSRIEVVAAPPQPTPVPQPTPPPQQQPIPPQQSTPQQSIPPQPTPIPQQQPPTQQTYQGNVGGIAPKPNNNKTILFVIIGLAAVVVIGIILAVVLVTGMLSGDSSDDPNVGIWKAEEVTMLGMTMNPEEIYPGGISLEIKSSDKCVLTLDGDSFDADYVIEGTTFTIKQAGDEFPGTIEGDVIMITNLLNMGLDIKFVKEGGSAGTMTDGTTDNLDDSSNDGVLSGKYMLSSMTTMGMTMSYEDIQMADMEMTLEFTDTGAQLMAYGSSVDTQIDLSAMTLVLEGVTMSYTVEGDDVIVAGESEGVEMELVFTAESSPTWADISASGSAIGESLGGYTSEFVAPGYGTETTVPVETLSLPSEWYGLVTISNYVGDGDISGDYEAWGYIEEDNDGQFFELYVDAPSGSEDTYQLMSFNIELHDYSFFPVVDEFAWLYNDATLKEEDNTWYVPSITNGILGASYDYDHNGEQFTLDFALAKIDDGSISSDAESEDAGSGEAMQGEASTDTGGSTSDKKFTIDELREIFLTIENLDSDVNTVLTYEEIVATYFEGVQGEIQYDDPDFKSYLWRSAEDDTAHLYISFEEDDSGVINYLSMSLGNISRDG